MTYPSSRACYSQLGRKRSLERETHNFKSTDSTIDKDPKLTLQVSSPRGFASEVGLPLRKPLEGELSHHRWQDQKPCRASRETRGGRGLEHPAKDHCPRPCGNPCTSRANKRAAEAALTSRHQPFWWKLSSYPSYPPSIPSELSDTALENCSGSNSTNAGRLHVPPDPERPSVSEC
jgi:hypothetical protein